jgi:hypothetical protein
MAGIIHPENARIDKVGGLHRPYPVYQLGVLSSGTQVLPIRQNWSLRAGWMERGHRFGRGG